MQANRSKAPWKDAPLPFGKREGQKAHGLRLNVLLIERMIGMNEYKRMEEIKEYRRVQGIAKETMEYIRGAARPGMALKEVRRLCEEKMRELGADSFWYWGIGAFVFSGDETALSVSGAAYETNDRELEEDDILTVDLSPQRAGVWGDYARTIILEKGRAVEKGEVARAEWREGLAAEDALHEALREFARPETTLEELYFHINGRIGQMGFVNLDFHGNLGHTIVRRREDRIYIEKGNGARLGEAGLFTFEPHIGAPGSKYGFKKENIYYFEGGTLREL